MEFALSHGVLEYRSIGGMDLHERRAFHRFLPNIPACPAVALAKADTPLLHYSKPTGAAPGFIITTFPLYQLHHHHFLLNYRV